MTIDVFDLLQTLVEHWWSEFTDLGDWPSGTFESIAEYIDLYPLVVCLLWCIYGLDTFVRSRSKVTKNQRLPSYSVLIPFHAEHDGALRTALSISSAYPPPEEIILLDDGSPKGLDQDEIDRLPPWIKVIRLEENGGKATALNVGLEAACSEVILCLDADTVIHTRDISALLCRFTTDAAVGAVTGKLWPVDWKSLPRLMQALDYLAVIGLVKSAENQWQGLMTVSGAFVAFRREALLAVGGWNESTAAEDIDLSWRLQGAGWKASYERHCIALVELVPTWHGLWLQRLRWSRGLGRTVREQFSNSLRPGSTHFPIALLTVLGVIWLGSSMLTGCIRLVATTGEILNGKFDLSSTVSHFLLYTGICYAFFILQLLVAILLDLSRRRIYPWLFLVAPLYPLYFWFISLSTFIVGFPQGFLRQDKGRWRRTVRSSEMIPYRGLQEELHR